VDRALGNVAPGRERDAHAAALLSGGARGNDDRERIGPSDR